MPRFIPSLTHSSIKIPPLPHHKGNYTETSNAQAKGSKRNRLETPSLLRQTQTFIGNTHTMLTAKEWRIHEDTMVQLFVLGRYTFRCFSLTMCLVFVKGQRERFQIILSTCLHEWRQARRGHTNTQRGQRSDYNIPHSSGHTHTHTHTHTHLTCVFVLGHTLKTG